MDEVKKLIQAMLISNADKAMTVAQLNRDFKHYEGCYIPYQEYGYKQLNAMLQSMSDVVQIQGYGPTALVLPVTTEKSQHIRKMVVQQKKNGKNVNSTRRHTNQNIRNDSEPRSIYNPANFQRRNDFMFSSLEQSSSSQESLLWQHNDRHLKTQPETLISAANSGQQNTKKMDIRCISKSVHQSHGQPVVPSMAEKKAVSAPAIPLTAMTLADNFPEHQLPPSVKPEAMLIALVISVLSPNNIYVHLKCQSERLVQISDELETMYADLDLQSGWHVQQEVAKEGLYCIAKYRDVWFRVVIAGPVVEDRVEVFLIDCAYKAFVALSDLRHMRKIDAILPLQTMRVSLAHVKPSEGEWKEEATRFLGEAMCGKNFHMYVVDLNEKGDIPQVVFVDTGNPTRGDVIIFNRELVLNKHAEWAHDD